MGGHAAWRKRVARGEPAKGMGGAIMRHRPRLGRKGKDLILNRKGHIAGGNPKKMKKRQRRMQRERRQREELEEQKQQTEGCEAMESESTESSVGVANQPEAKLEEKQPSAEPTDGSTRSEAASTTSTT